MVMLENGAIVGRTDTAAEPAGSNVGKVTILSFEETIFASGFD